jgi:transcriptional regulator GlxA family with amidase domain
VRLLASHDRLVPARTTGAVEPDATFDDLPDPDIIILPGGELDAALADAALMDWLRRAGAGARRVLAINNAPWLLAEAGLLDGREAVINPPLNSAFQAAAPKVKVVPNTRWVESDGVLTAAGAAAGMEAAIKVVGDFRGRFRGQMTARYFAVAWQPEMEPVPKDYSYLEEGGEASGEPAGDTGEADEKPAGDGTPAQEPPRTPAPRP